MRFVTFAALCGGMYVTLETLLGRDGVMAAVQRESLPRRQGAWTPTERQKEYKHAVWTLGQMKLIHEADIAPAHPLFRPRGYGV